LGQTIGSLLQMATGLASPVMQGVGAVMGAVQSGAQSAPGGAGGSGADGQAAGGFGGVAALNQAALGGGGVPDATSQAPPAAPGAAPATDTTPAAMHSNDDHHHGDRDAATPASVGMGGAPVGHGTKAGVDDRGHNAASFLHTPDQGDEIVGNLGSVAPPVIGELDANDGSDIELRI
jgi:hypothetical protein